MRNQNKELERQHKANIRQTSVETKICAKVGIEQLREQSIQILERLDPDNGLLLHPSLDHLFDIGLITFDEKGNIVISNLIGKSDLKTLNISSDISLSSINEKTKEYLNFHNNYVFKN